MLVLRLLRPSRHAGLLGRDAEWRQNVDTKFKTLSNKNNDNIAVNAKPWTYSDHGGNPQKNDITEVFAHSRVDNAGDTWVFFAASTRAPQGDNHTDFEFNQAGLTITGRPAADHRQPDLTTPLPLATCW